MAMRSRAPTIRGILAHYYKGTRLTSAPSRPVRVLLQPNDPYIRVRGATALGGRRSTRRKTTSRGAPAAGSW